VKNYRPAYKGYSSEPENVSFIYRLKLYTLFINGGKGTVLYRQVFVIDAQFNLVSL
jgi:hypothetical protein